MKPLPLTPENYLASDKLTMSCYISSIRSIVGYIEEEKVVYFLNTYTGETTKVGLSIEDANCVRACALDEKYILWTTDRVYVYDVQRQSLE